MKNPLFSQKGLSLVEVLVVLLLFTVIALAILRAYVSVAHVAGDSASGAKTDSSVMFGLATADKILQGIGYGANSDTTSSYGTTLRAYDSTGTAVSTGTTATSLVWKSDTSTCQALIISNKDNPLNSSSTTHTGSGLFYYGAGYSCSSLALPTSTTTSETPTVLIPVSDTNVAMASLKVITTTSCNPYSVTNTLTNGGAYAVVLTANVYAGSGTTQNQVNNQTCLFNFR
ncbi:prepilin-type N-terminal cleavage/methylation domain-containing protein [Acinetobacter sp. MB5]|uniref:prepilin-type N-terminal cleavage/methylation domain-containing protein n=1 Tax=Acinetobacter sp. MB5 TaxID=2069438 RepID=UPI000DD0C18C|nr:prepilin-type N-terminal cleavage/methylation domain-containing protein [Acinetobacter sp. MB5]